MANPLLQTSVSEEPATKETAYINLSVNCGTEAEPVYVELPWGIGLTTKENLTKNQQQLVAYLMRKLELASKLPTDSEERKATLNFDLPCRARLQGSILTEDSAPLTFDF